MIIDDDVKLILVYKCSCGNCLKIPIRDSTFTLTQQYCSNDAKAMYLEYEFFNDPRT